MSVIIIGAGAAGLFAAASFGSGKGVTVLEKNVDPGKKLLLTGNGQCNLTHAGSPEDMLVHYNGKDRFLKHAIYNLSGAGVIEFLLSLGIRCTEREDGKVFPESMSAHDIRDTLFGYAKRQGVSFRFRCPVCAVKRSERGFALETVCGRFSCDMVLLCTGGLSYPETGSEGDGFAIAGALGHRIIRPRPGLAGAKIRGFGLARMAGTGFEHIELSLIRNGKTIRRHRGPLLLTHTGISGPAVLDTARYMKKDDVISVNFFPETAIEKMAASVSEACRVNPAKKISTVISEQFLPKNFVRTFLWECGVDPEKQAAHLTRKEGRTIAEALCGYRMTIEEVGGFESAMVTAGGVDTAEIDSKTMESKIVPGLYFAGEVMDIDGDSGGYNLQAAFSTARLATESMSKHDHPSSSSKTQKKTAQRGR